jgi:hypothetical protein
MSELLVSSAHGKKSKFFNGSMNHVRESLARNTSLDMLPDSNFPWSNAKDFSIQNDRLRAMLAAQLSAQMLPPALQLEFLVGRCVVFKG